MVNQQLAPSKKAARHVLLAATAICACISCQANAAEWRTQMGVFRIGIAAQDGQPDAPNTYDYFRDEVSRALAMPVEIFVAKDMPALIDAQANRRVDYSIMTAISYRVVYRLCKCVHPIAAPTSADAATGVKSVLLGDGDAVKQLSDLSNARLAMGPAGSLTGDLVPSVQFRLDAKPPRALGAAIVDVASAGDAMSKLAADEVDAWFGWSFSKDGKTGIGNGSAERLKTLHNTDTVELWASSEVPFGPHVVRSDLAPEAVELLERMLLSIDSRAPLAFDAVSPMLGGPFRKVTPLEYNGLDAYIREWTDKPVTGPEIPLPSGN